MALLIWALPLSLSAQMTMDEAFSEGKSMGQGSTQGIFDNVQSGANQTEVPHQGGDTTTEEDFFVGGDGVLYNPALDKITTCAGGGYSGDPVIQQECEAVNFLEANPATRPKYTIQPTDSLRSTVNTITADPEAVAGELGQEFSECTTTTQTGPGTVVEHFCDSFNQLPVSTNNCNITLEIDVDSSYDYTCDDQKINIETKTCNEYTTVEVSIPPSYRSCEIGTLLHSYQATRWGFNESFQATNYAAQYDVYCGADLTLDVVSTMLEGPAVGSTQSTNSTLELNGSTGHYEDTGLTCTATGGDYNCTGVVCTDSDCAEGDFFRDHDANGDFVSYTWTGPLTGFFGDSWGYDYGNGVMVPRTIQPPFETVEHRYNQCDALEADATCTFQSKTCVDGPTTKLVDGVEVTLDCWEEESTYECRSEDTVNRCEVMTELGCTLNSTTCTETLPTTECAKEQYAYTCPEKYLLGNDVAMTNESHTITSEEWNGDACAQVSVEPNCELQQEVCVEGAETRTINGMDITRDCWKLEREYQCAGEKLCNKTLDVTTSSDFNYTCEEEQLTSTSTCQEELQLEVIPVDPILNCNPGDILYREHKDNGRHITEYCYGDNESFYVHIDGTATCDGGDCTYSNQEYIREYQTFSDPAPGEDCSAWLIPTFFGAFDLTDGKNDCASNGLYSYPDVTDALKSSDPVGLFLQHFSTNVCNATICIHYTMRWSCPEPTQDNACVPESFDIIEVTHRLEGNTRISDGLQYGNPDSTYQRPVYIPQPPIVNDIWVDRCQELKARVP